LRHQKYFLVAASTAALTFSQTSMAAGFAVSAQSAYGMGNAYAGNAAVASDASTVLTNPAGIFELDAPVFAAGIALTTSKVAYTDRGSLTNPLFGADPVAVAGGRSTSLTQQSVTPTPNLYYARQLNDQWAFGLGINVPFATSSDYGENWIGRYQAVETKVTAFDINPNVAYRINDTVSIGGGLTVQLASALLTSKLDSGATCLGIVAGANENAPPGQELPVTTCRDLGLNVNDPSVDSNAELDGNGTAITFNLGILIKPRKGTKLGVAYRHGTEHSLKGDANFTNEPALAAFVNGFPEGFQPLQDTGTTISADLPATLDLSVAQMANEKLELLGTLKWTQWSSFKTLTSKFDNPVQDPSVLAFNWEDTVTVSTGFNYSLNEKMTLRAGFSYDQSPIPNPTSRSARGAANDRYWYSFGGTYQFTKSISANAAFTHIQIDESAIANPGGPGNPTLRGSYKLDANLFAFQFNWHFV